MSENPRRRVPDASMELLNSIQRDTIDPEYAEVAAGGSSGKNRAPWLVLIACLLAGLMFTTSGLGAGGATTGAANERAELLTQIADLEERNSLLRGQLVDLSNEVQELERARLGDDAQPDRDAQVWAATTAVTGPGIVLTISDNPRDANGVIVDQDIRQVVNGLWLAGAEAIAINGHRLSARTAIRQAGSAVTVDYRSMTTPYRIEVVGDPDQLAAEFIQNPGGRWLAFLHRNYAVEWKIDKQTELQLAADAGLGVDRAGVP